MQENKETMNKEQDTQAAGANTGREKPFVKTAAMRESEEFWTRGLSDLFGPKKGRK